VHLFSIECFRAKYFTLFSNNDLKSSLKNNKHLIFSDKSYWYLISSQPFFRKYFLVRSYLRFSILALFSNWVTTAGVPVFRWILLIACRIAILSLKAIYEKNEYTSFTLRQFQPYKMGAKCQHIQTLSLLRHGISLISIRHYLIIFYIAISN